MSIIKLSKKDITRHDDEENEKIKLKRSNISYDSAMVSGWETSNKKSLETLNKYNDILGKNEWLSTDDLTSYRQALDSYIESSKYLRGINKVFAENYEDDEADWQKTIDSMENAYKSASEIYSKYDSADAYKKAVEAYEAQQKADAEYKKWFENIDSERASQGWQKYLTDREEEKNTAMYGKDDEKWYETLGRWLGGGVVDTTLPNAGVTQTINDLRVDESHRRPNDDWTDDQRNVFGDLYYLSPDLAYTFAEETNKRNNQKKEEDALKAIFDSATSSFGAGLGHTVGSIVAAPMGMADYLGDLAMANAGRDIAPDGQVSPFEYSQAVTGGITTHLNEQGGTLNENIPIIGGKGWGDVYGLGVSTAQSLVSAYTMGPVGTLVSYFGQGAAAGVDEALARGASDDQAILYGLAVGAFEGVAEMIGIDNLFKLGSSKTLKGFIGNILKQAGAEGMEEGLTSVLGNIADVWIMQDKSNFSQALQSYMSAGMSESDAKWKVFWDSIEGIAFDTIAGAASGGISGVIHTTAQTVSSNKQASNLYGNGADLVAEAQEIGGEAGTLAEKYQAKLDKGKSLSGGQINRLIETNEQTLKTQDASKMKSAVEARLTKLGENGNVSALAEVIVKQASGEKLSRSEQAVIKNSKYGQRVSNEMSPENIKSGEYTSAWAENLGTEKINREAYNKELYALASEKAGVVPSFTSEASEQQEANASVTENAPAKEIATEGKFEVSAEGKTIIKETGNVVNVEEIVSDENGNLKLKLDNGETVNASDLAYATNDEALVYEMVTKMDVDPNTAMALVKAYNPASGVKAQTYAIDIPLAYQYGKVGYKKGLAKLNLTSEQSATAYVLGRDIVKASGRTWSDTSRKTPETNKSKAADDGIIYDVFELNEDSLTDIQKASLAGIRTLAKMSSSLEIHITESVVENGKKYIVVNGKKKLAPNGYFRNGNEIYLDINAGKGTMGAMLYTASHEVVHFIAENSFEDFQALADFLFEHYGENNVPVDALIKREIDNLKKTYEVNGKELPSEKVLYMKAYEEVVANAMSKMLADPTSYEKLAKLKSENLTLWEKIGEAIKHMLDKLKSMLGIYEGRTPDAYAAHYVDDFSIEVYNKLQDLYLKGFVNAEAKYEASIGSRKLEDFADAKNTEGDTLLQYKAMEADEDTYREMLKKWGKMSDSQISNLFLTIDNAMELIKDNLEALDYAWEADIDDRAFSPVKPNSDKLYQVSLDFSTLCRKRILQQTVQAQLQEALNKPLTREEGIAIRDALIAVQEEGRQIEVACALCYVESARMKSPEQIRKFMNNKEKVIKEFFAGKSGGSMKEMLKTAETDARAKLHKENPDGIKGKDGSTMLDPRTASLKALPKKYADAIRSAKKAAKESYVPTAEEQRLIEVAKGMTVSDFTSPEGLENLAKNYRDLFDAYTSFVRNATKSKGVESDTWWRAGDSMQIGDVLIANMNRENGLRSQSWSDFQVVHILDYIAATIELATRNTKEQAYTKVPDFAELMGNTGVMINLSLIPTAKFNGKLEYDSVEGIDYKRSLELRDKYHATVGTICIGVDNVQIQMLLGDMTVDYVIPYHKSGMAAHIRKAMHIPTWTEYEAYQSEKNLSRADAEKQAKKYGVKLLAEGDPNYHKGTSFSEWFDIKEAQQIAKIENANPSDKAKQKKYGVMYGGYMAMQNAANNYLKLCAERGISPKFSHEKADFTAEDNYWKLLIDRKMVDNITGEVIEQQTIKPVFDEAEVMRILNDELERYPKVKADQEYAIRKVTEAYLSGDLKGGMSAKDIAKIMQTPVDNVTTTNIVASAREIKEFDSSKEKIEQNIKDVAEMSSVYNVDKSKLEKTGKRPSDIFDEHFKSWGNNLRSDELGDITVEKSSIKSEIRHGITAEKIASIEAIPTVVKEGRVIFVGQKSESGLQRIVVCAPIKIGNTPYYMGVMLQRDVRTQRLYLHNVAIEKEASEISQDDLLTTGSHESNEHLFVTSILQNALVVKYQKNKNLPSEQKVDDSDTLFSIDYSDQDSDSVSTRSLLANALETTAQNDIEKNKLAQYKSKIDLIESEYEKLTELRAKIKELSFAKGARDTKAIKDLQFQANQTANRINTYDRQLLNLESTTALKNVLNREKELARRKEAQKGKDALAKYKEKAAKTQRELMERNTESRKKAIEGRNKTDMRHNIRNIVEELNNLLLNPTKDKHVPISLQKPVASALAVINMDTVGADERIAKYNALIAKAKDPDEIARLTKSRDNIEFQGENLKDKLTNLQNAYAALLKSDDPLIKNAHNEAIENLIENTVQKVGDTSIRNMSLEQLEAVYDMFKAIKATVRNANKMFKEGKQETITDNSEWVKREVSAAGGHRDRILKATKWLKKFGWNMLKPIYAMKLIGSDVLTGLYENVRKGEDTWAVDVNEAKDFFKETAKKYEYNTWDFKKQYKFTDSAGHSFSLTIEQIMSLYAYSKRSQADKHLELGGFIFDDSIEVTKKNKLGIPMKHEANDANPYRLKKEDLAKVISILDTDLNNVKGFVDEMQAYLSDVMGAKGNEVSLAMYDIKLYKEQNYFPLKSAKYFREFDPEKNGTPKIKNSGFSKNTVPQAGNPIILSNFMDVWANHVNDMSMYHAFVLPLEDFMRVYNYSSTAGGYDSVQQYIKNAYGAQANSYIETLMNDLNGGARSDPATDLIGKGMSLFKKAAVFASASVVIQQPSAIARAMAYIDAKYFVDKPSMDKHSETWAEVKKYAPVAIIKEMGYFDTNMGRSTVDWIKEEKTLRDKIDDVASKAPALADELAWSAIWKAVKREIADSTNLKVGSEEFLEMAGKRFTEVVTKTQVYDSVLSRSALMRSKDSGAKMITAFMAEPTTSLNMVVDAIIEGKRGNKKFAGKVVGAVATSIILNSILVSLVTAARDDDDDETYAEKYLESLTAELLDGFNPLTYIPLVKDIWSIAQGYDIERSDMSVWSDLWQSVENLFSDNKSGFEKTEGIVGSIASIFGLPLKNLMRDARAIYNLASTLLSGTPTTWAGVGEAVGGAVKDSIPLYSRIEKWVGADESKSDKLYDAIISGDKAHIDRVKAQYKDEKAIESAIKQGLRENDPRIRAAVQAVIENNQAERIRLQKEIIAEKNFKQDIIVEATNAEISYVRQKIKEAQKAKKDGDDEEFNKIIDTLIDRGYPKDFVMDAIN